MYPGGLNAPHQLVDHHRATLRYGPSGLPLLHPLLEDLVVQVCRALLSDKKGPLPQENIEPLKT
jgi:hypothetical protein